MTTMQTVHKGMPKGLMDAITQFMEETGAERIDIRRGEGGLEESEPLVNVVMSDDEEPESDTLHSGSLAVLPAGPVV